MAPVDFNLKFAYYKFIKLPRYKCNEKNKNIRPKINIDLLLPSTTPTINNKFDRKRRSVEDQSGGRITYRRIAHRSALARLSVIQEFQAGRSVTVALQQALDGVQEYTNRMSAADRVVVLAQVTGERFRIQALDYVHAHAVESFYGLVDGAARTVVTGEAETAAPMTEIGRHDKQVLGIR